MTDIRIGRLALTGRLPGDDAAARERSRSVLAVACGELLEQAFERAGLGDEGELCIRALDLEVQLPFERGDVEMATAWSLRVAEAARAAVLAGGAGVVRYESVAQALCDVLGSAAQGDFRRAWAWSQLDLWAGGTEPRGVVAALTARPELCAAALRETAARGRLAPLLRALPGEAWASVARAALMAAGATPALVDTPSADLPERSAMAGAERDGAQASGEAHDDAAQVALRARMRRLASASPLGLAVARAAALGLSPEARRALAVLVLADADPAALRGARARSFVAALDDELRPRAPRPRARRDDHERDAQAAAADSGAEPRHAGGRAAREHDVAAEPGSPVSQDAAHPAPSRDAPAAATDATRGAGAARASHAEADAAGVGDASRPAREEEREARAHPPDASGDDSATLDDAFAEADDDGEPPIARQRGHTRFGGLLFLLHLVDALGLADRWSDDGPLAARPLRVALHGLALALLRDEAGFTDVADDDPAVLAFAGLRPLDPPPRTTTDAVESPASPRPPAATARRDEAPEAFTPEEQAAVAEAARRMAEALAERLPEDFAEGASQDESRVGPGSALLAGLVARRAEVVADPGWIELRLALEEMDTRVRRAGLDLDPGHVPWLGVVVKFRYV